MHRRNMSSTLLFSVTIISLLLLPFAIIKRPLKDWIIVYLYSMISNSISDKYLVSKGYLKYNIRPFRKSFKTHLPFDYVIYPLLLLYYNQWTLHSKPTGILLKPCAFVIPQVIIETIAEKKTDLITWRKGWSWYHSFITLFAKMLVCRLIIGLIRKVNKDNLSLLHDEKS